MYLDKRTNLTLAAPLIAKVMIGQGNQHLLYVNFAFVSMAQWKGCKGAIALPLNFSLSKNVFLLENFIPNVQNLGLKIPHCEVIRGHS